MELHLLTQIRWKIRRVGAKCCLLKVFPTYFLIVQIRRIYINRFFNNISCLCFPSCTDNGGGINPDKMRQCMSLGYSTKSKSTNTIGQCEFSHLNEKYLCDNLAIFIIYCRLLLLLLLCFLPRCYHHSIFVSNFIQMEMALRQAP